MPFSLSHSLSCASYRPLEQGTLQTDEWIKQKQQFAAKDKTVSSDPQTAFKQWWLKTSLARWKIRAHNSNTLFELHSCCWVALVHNSCTHFLFPSISVHIVRRCFLFPNDMVIFLLYLPSECSTFLIAALFFFLVIRFIFISTMSDLWFVFIDLRVQKMPRMVICLFRGWPPTIFVLMVFFVCVCVHYDTPF